MQERIECAVRALQEKIGSAKIGVILGSGLGDYGKNFTDSKTVPYQDIKGLLLSTVPGHKGEFVHTRIGSNDVLLMRGRFHFYEGYSMQEVTMPIRIMAKLGIDTLVVTNAAGGVNTEYAPGDLMMIKDHISFGENPLSGPNADEYGPRFPDMSQVYDRAMIAQTHAIAKDLGITLREGVYFNMRGPSFETPAEIRALRVLGADAVGMSTVPEAVVARHCGMRVLGISCISNMAAGIYDQPLSHQEVIQTGLAVKDTFTSLMNGILASI